MTRAVAAPRGRRPLLLAGLGLAAVAALALLAVWLWPADGDAPVALHAQVPATAGPVVWLDAIEPAAHGLRRLADRVPGTAGVRDALTLAFGVDLLDAEALQEAGLRPDAGAVAYRWDDAGWLVLPVRGREGVDHVLQVLRNRGYQPEMFEPAPAGTRATWRIGGRTDARQEAARLWWLGPVLLGRVPLTSTAAPPDTALTAWQKAPRLAHDGLQRPSGELHLRAALAAGGAEQQALHDLLGPANLLFGGVIDRLERAEADLQLDAERPQLRLALRGKPGALADVAAYHAGFLAEEPAGLLDVGDLLPDETVLLVRARVNPQLLQLVPAALRDAFLPASALAAIHPALVGVDARSQLVAELDGQLVLGVLGVADEVPLDPRVWPTLSWRKALRLFAAGELRTDVAAEALLLRCRSALETSLEPPRSIQLGTWAGFGVAGPEAPWLLLRQGRRVAFVSGEGTAEDLQRIADKKFPSLGQHVQGDLEQALVAGRAYWLGALVTTPRLARSLRRRGLPDHFVQMLASVSAAAVGVRLGPDGLDVELQVRPAEELPAAGRTPTARAAGTEGP